MHGNLSASKYSRNFEQIVSRARTDLDKYDVRMRYALLIADPEKLLKVLKAFPHTVSTDKGYSSKILYFSRFSVLLTRTIYPRRATHRKY